RRSATVVYVRIESLSKGTGGGKHQYGDDGQNRGEGHCGDESEEEVSAQRFGQERCGHVSGFVGGGDFFLSDEQRRPEAEEGGHDVEGADDEHGPYHGNPRFPRRRDRVEADQDVGESGRPRQQGDAQGDVVEGIVILQARLQEFLSVFGGDLVEHVYQVEVVIGQDQDAQQDGSGHQQHGLDDLHPGGGQHAPEGHVEDHQHADDDDRPFVVDAQKQFDDPAGPDQLGDHVEGGDRQGAQRRRRTDRFGLHPVGQHVGDRVPSRVAKGFRHDQEHDEIGDQPADGIEEAVITEQGDQSRDPEEGGGAHVIPGDGDAVLPAADGPARRVEVGGGPGAFGGPIGDIQGDGYDDAEEHESRRVHRSFPFSLATIFSTRRSVLLALRTYRMAMIQAMKNWERANR